MALGKYLGTKSIKRAHKATEKEGKGMKKLAAALVALLGLMGLIAPSPANSAGNISIRWDRANSTGFAWQLDNKAANEDIANFVRYFTPGVKLIDVVAQVGSTITLRFQVKDGSGNAMANTEVTAVLNPAYTYGTAQTTFTDGSTIPTVNGAPQDGALKALKTDANGFVSMTLTNKDTVGEPSVPNDGKTVPAEKIYTQVVIWQGNYASTASRSSAQTSQDVDIVEIHYLTEAKAPTPAATPTPIATPTPTPTVAPKLVPSMRLVSPSYSAANSVDTTGDIAQWYTAKTKAWYTYVQAGTTLTLKYLVTKDGSTPLANTEVTLQVNAPYSASKANWLAGSTKISAPTTDSASGADLKATTNSAGEVTFVIKNTDTANTEAVPATPNATAPKTRLYGTFKPVITGFGDKEADVDLVTFDIYGSAPKPVVKATTITCVKGKATKKVTAVNPKCPAGYKKK